MQMKSILVPLRTPEAVEIVMPVAAMLARRWDAHVIGVHVMEALIEAVYPGAIAVADIERISDGQRERAERIRKDFDARLSAEGLNGECRVTEAASMTAADRIIEQARAADLVVMSQVDPDKDAANASLWLERVIRKSGRPVLVVPYAGSFKTLGEKALIGWSPTRESARAAHDAIPVLAPGGKAAILTAHHGYESGGVAVETAKDLALCYDRHGHDAEVIERVEDGIPVGDLLLNESFERGSDLIVAGAFGHSRVYDFVIGATTTKLLESMTVPVLFSS